MNCEYHGSTTDDGSPLGVGLNRITSEASDGQSWGVA